MYSKNVERAYPGCIIFVVDQSFSMTDGIAGTTNPKCESVTTAINRFITELIAMCEKGEDEPRSYFDIGVIGYTTDKSAVPIIGPVLQGSLAGRDLVSVVDLYREPLDVEIRQKDDGVGGLIDIRFSIWYKTPSHDQMAGTPMMGAMQYVRRVAEDWCLTHPDSFPPVVIHLTDGESNDGDPLPEAEALKMLGTSDGSLLLLNCHLSDKAAMPLLFPSDESELPDDYARMLYRMSSELPQRMVDMAETKHIHAPVGARGMAFNADITSMLQLISVGTVVATPNNLR